MQNEAVTRMSADDTEVNRAWDRQFQRFKQSETAIDRLAKASEKAAGESKGSWATAWEALPVALNQGIELAKKLGTALVEAYSKAHYAAVDFEKIRGKAKIEEDKLLRQPLREMGLGRITEDAGQVREMIKDLADAYADPTLGRVAKGVETMADVGFDQKDLVRRGGIAEEFLKYQLAVGEEGDMEGIVRSTAKIITAQRKPLTLPNVQETLTALERSGTQFRLPAADVASLADSFTALAERGVEFNEALAVYAQLIKQLDPTRAAKVMEMMARKIPEAARAEAGMTAANPQRSRALMELGITNFEDLDLRKHGLMGVVDKVAAGMEKLMKDEGEVYAQGAIGEIFGPRADVGFLALRGRGADVAANKVPLKDRAGFTAQAAEMAGGADFEMRRAEAATRRATAEHRTQEKFEVDLQTLKAAAIRANVNPTDIELFEKFARSNQQMTTEPGRSLKYAAAGEYLPTGRGGLPASSMAKAAWIGDQLSRFKESAFQRAMIDNTGFARIYREAEKLFPDIEGPVGTDLKIPGTDFGSKVRRMFEEFKKTKNRASFRDDALRGIQSTESQLARKDLTAQERTSAEADLKMWQKLKADADAGEVREDPAEEVDLRKRIAREAAERDVARLTEELKKVEAAKPNYQPGDDEETKAARRDVLKGAVDRTRKLQADAIRRLEDLDSGYEPGLPPPPKPPKNAMPKADDSSGLDRLRRGQPENVREQMLASADYQVPMRIEVTLKHGQYTHEAIGHVIQSHSAPPRNRYA